MACMTGNSRKKTGRGRVSPGNRGQGLIGILVVMVFVATLLLMTLMGVPFKFSIVVVVSCLIFTLSFINTDAALSILIFSMLLSPEFLLGGVSGRSVVLRADDVFLLVIFFGWLAKMAINKDLGLLKATPLNRPLLAYVLICIVSSGFGVLQGTNNPKQSFFYLLKYAEYFLLFFMVTNSIHRKGQVRRFTYLMFVTCVLVSIYALAVYSPTVRATAPFEGRTGEPNTLAGYLIVIISMAIGIFIYSPSTRQKLMLGGFIGFLAVPFTLTLSRSGWLSFVPAYLTFIILSGRKKVLLVLVLVLLLATGPLFFPKEVVQRYRTIVPSDRKYTVMSGQLPIDESAWLRVKSYENSIAIWAKYPILGLGVPGGGSVSDVQYSRVLREVGIVGFLIFIWMLFALFRVGIRTFKDPRLDDFGRGISLGFICALAGLVVMGVGTEVFIIIRIMEPFWFLAAMVTVLPETYSEEEAPTA